MWLRESYQYQEDWWVIYGCCNNSAVLIQLAGCWGQSSCTQECYRLAWETLLNYQLSLSKFNAVIALLEKWKLSNNMQRWDFLVRLMVCRSWYLRPFLKSFLTFNACQSNEDGLLNAKFSVIDSWLLDYIKKKRCEQITLDGDMSKDCHL